MMKIFYRNFLWQKGDILTGNDEKGEATRFFQGDKIAEAFGKSLKILREYKSLPQVRVAEMVDIPFQTLSTYERGRNTPSMTQALKIAGYFHLTIEDFVECGLNEVNGDAEIVERYKKALKKGNTIKK